MDPSCFVIKEKEGDPYFVTVDSETRSNLSSPFFTSFYDKCTCGVEKGLVNLSPGPVEVSEKPQKGKKRGIYRKYFSLINVRHSSLMSSI